MNRTRLSGMVLCALLVGQSHGATKYAKVGGTGDCTSWADACSLAAAINAADASTSDQVWVQEGTYGPITLKNGVKIIGGFAGTETLVNQSNPTLRTTILDGAQSAPCATNFNTTPGGLPAYLRGFTLRNGRDGGSDEGGALQMDNSDARIVNCVFENNSATQIGGAVSIRGAGSPQFVNCIFRANGKGSTNPLDTKGGGAVFLRDGTPQFVNCLFDGNQAGEGGAVIIAEGLASFVNCTFVNNKSTVGRGGAIFDPDGRVTLKNCILWSNKRLLSQGASADQIYSGSGGTTEAIYSNIESGWSGSNNLSTDPLFSNAAQGNFRLTASSPCKNTGDPADTSGVAVDSVDLDWDSNTNEPIPKDLDMLPRVRLGRVDMGAFELFSDSPPGGGDP